MDCALNEACNLIIIIYNSSVLNWHNLAQQKIGTRGRRQARQDSAVHRQALNSQLQVKQSLATVSAYANIKAGMV